MTKTSHGHHIPDSPTDDERDGKVYRCGGPGLCAVCSTETGKWAEEKFLQGAIDKFLLSGKAGHQQVIQAARYQTKPAEIVALQYNGGTSDGWDIVNWIKTNGGNASYQAAQDPQEESDGYIHPAIVECLNIETDAGWTQAKVGYWIIQGTAGEFYPCRPDVFANKYEPKE